MPLLIVNKNYSVNMDKQNYVTESFLRHVDHGNKLLFSAVYTEEAYGDPEEILQFMCLGCGRTFEYRIARHFIQSGLIRIMNESFFNGAGSIAIEVNWKLVGTDCSIAHLYEYKSQSEELLKRIFESHMNPNRLFKRGLTKIF